MSSVPKKFTLILFILLALFLVGGGIYYWQLNVYNQTGESALKGVLEPPVTELTTSGQRLEEDSFLRGVVVSAVEAGSVEVAYGSGSDRTTKRYQYGADSPVVCWPRTLQLGGQQVDALTTLFALSEGQSLYYQGEREFVYRDVWNSIRDKNVILDVERQSDTEEILKFIVIDCDF
jgi:hypothetical protein